jgi:hypothetical protein
MKLIRRLWSKLAWRAASKSKSGTTVGIDLNLPKPPPFKGFKYTVAEGIALSKRGYTEIPSSVPDTK